MRDGAGGLAGPAGPGAAPGGVVSVVIPVYNGAAHLRQAIQSVLTQTYPNLQVIVVDDGSTDESAPIAQSFGSLVRHCHQPQSGAGAARNRGVELADGEWITFQ